MSFGTWLGGIFGRTRVSSAGSAASLDTIARRTVDASLGAAAIRAFDKDCVVQYVKSLGVNDVNAKKLRSQNVNGAALLETSVDELCDRYGLSGGAAHTIVRAIAPAVAEVQAATSEAQTVTLTIYPPKSKGPSNTFTVRATPSSFPVIFDLQSAPLRIANTSGSVLSIACTLAEAVEASRKGLFLMASRRFDEDDEDLATLNGFQADCATAFEIKSTRALASDANLSKMYGSLELVNSGEEVEVRLSRRGKAQLVVKPDGLVVSSSASVVLFNSAKLTPSVNHIDELLDDVATLQLFFGDWANMTTIPPSAKARLRWDLRIVPVLSGDNISAAVEAKCVEKGVVIVRPSGVGFVVKTAGASDGLVRP